MHFGLGIQTSFDSLVAECPSGIQQILTSVNANQTLTIQKSNTTASENILAESGGIILMQNFPNPFQDQTNIRFYLPQAMPISVLILNTKGSAIQTL